MLRIGLTEGLGVKNLGKHTYVIQSSIINQKGVNTKYFVSLNLSLIALGCDNCYPCTFDVAANPGDIYFVILAQCGYCGMENGQNILTNSNITNINV